MKKILGIILILFSVTGTGYAQNKEVHTDEGQNAIFIAKEKKADDDIRIPIMKAIGSSMDIDELIKIKKNTAQLLAVAVSFDEKGLVDTVYLSKVLSAEVTRILKPGAYITKKVREIFKGFPGYKSKVVIFPCWYMTPKGATCNTTKYC